MKKSPLALPFELALSINAADKLIAKVDAEVEAHPFTFLEREWILALGGLRARRDELVKVAAFCSEISERFQGSPAPGTEVRICSSAPSR
jgi:hypothetical protein